MEGGGAEGGDFLLFLIVDLLFIFLNLKIECHPGLMFNLCHNLLLSLEYTRAFWERLMNQALNKTL